eukprot:172249_1
MELDKMRLHGQLEQQQKELQEQKKSKLRKKRDQNQLALQHIHTVNPHEEIQCEMCVSNKIQMSILQSEQEALLAKIVALESKRTECTASTTQHLSYTPNQKSKTME